MTMTNKATLLTATQERQLRVIGNRNAYDGEASYVRHLAYHNGAAIAALVQLGLVRREPKFSGETVELTETGRKVYEQAK